MEKTKLLFFLACAVAALRAIAGATLEQDVVALRGLMGSMMNLPPGWRRSSDLCCPMPWKGVKCIASRVTELKLYNMGLRGTVSGDIGSLAALRNL
ncbi:hypothetical protein HPP92_021213 [Vanilla planifolia]|uniref:Leucine-rich repeat-containing N-terminal plant-type domain-containing protein n=1 Tax=Vanilla planifolia TaxID=51239 RepID=A0A835UIR6_VANPL|nr:hypothetical protein HPP92_021213 [Vanilla planifolia]